jgi:hypothetical protein
LESLNDRRVVPTDLEISSKTAWQADIIAPAPAEGVEIQIDWEVLAMRDDGGDLFRRGLLLAGGCAGLGAILLVRSDVASAYPAWFPWLWLVLALPVAAAGIETGYYTFDLASIIASLACCVLGLILYLVGLSMARNVDNLLNLGPLFALAGFGGGALCAGAVLKENFGDLFERPKDDTESDVSPIDPVPTGPTKACPNCGQSIPRYAAACRFCKCILVK